MGASPGGDRRLPWGARTAGVPGERGAAGVLVGPSRAELREGGRRHEPVSGHIAVKEAVLPFNRFPDVDTLLGPEMRSTGEVMGVDATVGLAFAKSQSAAGDRLPEKGTVFLSLADRDKASSPSPASRLLASLETTADSLTNPPSPEPGFASSRGEPDQLLLRQPACGSQEAHPPARKVNYGRGFSAAGCAFDGEIYGFRHPRVHLLERLRRGLAGEVGARRVERFSVSGEHRPHCRTRWHAHADRLPRGVIQDKR